MDKTLEKIFQATREQLEEYSGCPELSCFCAIASYVLVEVAAIFKYNLNLVEGIAFDDVPYVDYDDEEYNPEDLVNHVWVEYKGTIIDITATQFGIGDKIHIVDNTNEEYYPVRYNYDAKDSLQHHWPQEQTPYSILNDLDLIINSIYLKVVSLN